MLSRRTFLKAAAIAIVGTPTIANAKQKTIEIEKFQWISFMERIPEPGQKILLANISGTFIAGGVAAKNDVYYEEIPDNKIAFSIVRRDFERYIHTTNLDHTANLVYSDEGEKTLVSRKWLKPIGKVKYEDWKCIYYCHYNNLYVKSRFVWLPVNGEYPTKIPSFPTELTKKQSQKYTSPGCRSRWFEYLFSENKNGI